MGRLKCTNQNKDARNYSDHHIDMLLGSIKYFDKINLDRSCIFNLIDYNTKNWKTYTYSDIHDAIRMLLEYKDLFTEANVVKLHVIFTDCNDETDFYKYDNMNMLDLKPIIEKKARSLLIAFDRCMSQVYYIIYYSGKEFDGTSYGYDMKYTYDPDKCIKLEPYAAYKVDVYRNFDTYEYGKFKSDIAVWFVEPLELIQDDTPMKYNSSGHAICGCYQYTAGDGRIWTDDMDTPIDNIMPMAAIKSYADSRPTIPGITRYKAIIKFPSGITYPFYGECKTGDIASMIKHIASYDWAHPEICTNTEDYIQSLEALPDGEWF